MKFNRVLLKLSGEALEGSQGYGIDPVRLADYAAEVKSVVDEGVQVAIVIGGGNIFRGLQGTSEGMDRVQGDYMGMLATVINSMAIQAALEKLGLKVKLLSGLAIDPICDAMSRRKAVSHLAQGHVVVIAAGTGNPYFTTDTTAALRAIEIGAEVILKATKVDGVYSSDPMKNKKARRYESLRYIDVLKKGLKVMDATAISLCMDNKLPIIVLNLFKEGNIKRVILGEKIGTMVKG